MKVILTGGTGFIGKVLAESLLSSGYKLAIISRHPHKIEIDGVKLNWDTKEVTDFIQQDNYAVINLAGMNIASVKWTEKNKERIKKSRFQTIHFFSQLISETNHNPNCFIQSSAIGYYGTSEEKAFTEKSQAGKGFLAELSKDVEDLTKKNITANRIIYLRTGLVLGRQAGVLKKLLIPFKFYTGGHFGNGKQFYSWIHIQDEVNAILFLLESQNTSGAYNLTAPEVVTMKQFCKTTGKIKKRPSWFHVPGFILKLMFGEMAKEALLKGQKVIPEKLINEGFEFKYPNLDSALKDLLK